MKTDASHLHTFTGEQFRNKQHVKECVVKKKTHPVCPPAGTEQSTLKLLLELDQHLPRKKGSQEPRSACSRVGESVSEQGESAGRGKG